MTRRDFPGRTWMGRGERALETAQHGTPEEETEGDAKHRLTSHPYLSRRVEGGAETCRRVKEGEE